MLTVLLLGCSRSRIVLMQKQQQQQHQQLNPLTEMKMFQRTEAAFKLHLQPSKSRLMSNVLVQSANYSGEYNHIFLTEACMNT